MDAQQRLILFPLRYSSFFFCVLSILAFLLSFFVSPGVPSRNSLLLFASGADLSSSQEEEEDDSRVREEAFFFASTPVTSSLFFSLLSGVDYTQERKGAETKKEWMENMAAERTGSSPSSSSSPLSMMMMMMKPEKKLSRRDLELNVRRSLGSLVEDVFQILIQNLKKVFLLSTTASSSSSSSSKDKRRGYSDTQEERENEKEEERDFPLRNTKVDRYYTERFPNEPDNVRELFPLLLDDQEAYDFWRMHFTRHLISGLTDRMLKDLSQDITRREEDQSEEKKKEDTNEEEEQGLSSSGNRLNLLDVIFLEAKKVFWDSRPASSQAAVNLINKTVKELQENSATFSASSSSSPRARRLLPSWKAEVSPRFRTLSIRDAKALMGTYLVHYPVQVEGKKIPVKPVSLPPRSYSQNASSSSSSPLPEEFDSREAFPFCKDVIAHVRDQGDCGSCWAFASTEALNDRTCIRSKGKVGEFLSAQHTTSCCNAIHCASFGCNGGQPGMAWRWFQRNGVVTGGDYESLNEGKTCWPYEIPNCAHHAKAPFPDCESGVLPRKTPKCRKECEEQDYTARVHPFKEDLHRASSSYSLRSREDIKRDMMAHGSVTGAFMVYEDFLSYKSGVYTHVTGMPIGGHAIKIIGWGRVQGGGERGEDLVEYWQGVNSWNEYWGDEGTFKIQMGEAGIDDEIVAGEALTPPAAIEELEKASLEKNKESGEEEEDEAARTSLHGTVNLGRVEKQGEREEEKEKEFDRQRNSAVEFLFYAEERVPRDEGPPPRAAASASAPLIDRKKQQEGQSQGEVEEDPHLFEEFHEDDVSSVVQFPVIERKES